MRKRISILILIISFFSFTQYAFAETEHYYYDSNNIDISISDSTWTVYTLEDKSYWEDNLDEATFNSIYNIFDSNSNIEFVAIANDGKSYWTFMPFGNGSIPSELGSYSEEEWRSFRLSDLSESEIYDLFKGFDSSQGFEKEFDSINSLSGEKYYVNAGMATNNGVSLPLFTYITIVNGYTYTFNLYILENTKEATLNAIEVFNNDLSNIVYKPRPEKQADIEESGTSNSDTSIDNTDRSKAVMTTLLAVLPLAFAFLLIRLLLKRKKDSNKSADAIKTSSDTNSNPSDKDAEETHLDDNVSIPYNDLKALKQLYDSGVITEEEYALKKKQILGI